MGQTTIQAAWENVPVDMRRNDNVVISSKNDVAMSLWRNNNIVIAEAIITSLLRQNHIATSF